MPLPLHVGSLNLVKDVCVKKKRKKKKSKWEAKAVVGAGAGWKVGSGNSINIVGQPWLSDDQNPYITSNSQVLVHSKVSSIMALDKREWNEDILKDLFNDRDQQCIRNVYLGEVD